METSLLKTLTLNRYPLQTMDKVRYADTDRQGHVNNSVYSQFFETGRVEVLYHPEHPLYKPGCSFVIASSKIDYLHEIKWPGTVEIGTAVIRLGNSSIQLQQGLYQDNVVVATCETIIVQVDNKTTLSSPLSPNCKETLSKFLWIE